MVSKFISIRKTISSLVLSTNLTIPIFLSPNTMWAYILFWGFHLYHQNDHHCTEGLFLQCYQQASGVISNSRYRILPRLPTLITFAKQDMTGKTLAAKWISSGLSDFDGHKNDFLTTDCNTSSIVFISDSWICCFMFHQFIVITFP